MIILVVVLLITHQDRTKDVRVYALASVYDKFGFLYACKVLALKMCGLRAVTMASKKTNYVFRKDVQ